jgi:hypothetical protein
MEMRMHADVPPVFQFVLTQAPTPPASSRLEVSSPPAVVRPDARVGSHPMLVMGTPESAVLWPLVTFAASDNLQLVIQAKLSHPAWKTRKPDFSSGGFILQAATPFDLNALHQGTLKRFKVSVSKEGAERPEWRDVEVQVKAVPWNSPLLVHGASVPRLLYRILSAGGMTFLVHELSGNPDFHHVVRVKFQDRRFTEEQLAQGLMVEMGDRPNVKGAKLPLGDSPKGSLVDGKPAPFKVERELLFREVTAPDEPPRPWPGASP